MRRLAPVFGAVVPPRPDRWHSAPTPTMGGIAIAVATVAGFAVGLAGPLLQADVVEWSAVLIAGLAMFVVGFFDDRLQLSPVAKLVASLACDPLACRADCAGRRTVVVNSGNQWLFSHAGQGPCRPCTR